MSVVQFRNILKTYGALVILQDLNLKVDDGEFLVLLGPSGCGKTTLLNLLAGLIEPQDGEIIIDGRDVTDLDPRDRGLAMVFQSYALYPTKTVRGNMRFALTARGLPADEIDRRIAWAAKMLQLEHLLDRKPAQLSGGQRQRVAIGRALVRQVGLFLFDEPLSNLDAKLRNEMRIEIKKLHNELKNTIVYVTHDQVEAMTMATRIAVMNKGLVEQIGTPTEIYDRPESVFVAGFVGSPGMNFLDCTIKLDQGRPVAAADHADARFDLSSYGWSETPGDGARVTLGFRPESISVEPGEAGARGQGTALTLPLQMVERSGAESTAFLTFSPKETIAVRSDPGVMGRLNGSQTPTVHVPAGVLNLFNRETGRRL
ncbi:ATP-binding cassette domain-containing protein [Rhizobium sp. BK251]|uniref:ABC transporter ATP-binding protein n=1 Tax=Rhizobium sp. BK251 TaxID=2512125 RepID=UPI00104F4554|nr:ATP-binding cassette domain-containing protein [Rhizobium sp. BK251]TCL71041.1 multiple sugar transport system ATP-binding protein [Rhizobium sp. BK251]